MSLLAGQRAVFSEDFGRLRLGAVWGWQSGAYTDCTTNPGQHKLDQLTRTALTAHGA
ncbi:hypothetical protein [Streptacidiphilus sp. PAMC 29251]